MTAHRKRLIQWSVSSSPRSTPRPTGRVGPWINCARSLWAADGALVKLFVHIFDVAAARFRGETGCDLKSACSRRLWFFVMERFWRAPCSVTRSRCATFFHCENDPVCEGSVRVAAAPRSGANHKPAVAQPNCRNHSQTNPYPTPQEVATSMVATACGVQESCPETFHGCASRPVANGS